MQKRSHKQRLCLLSFLVCVTKKIKAPMRGIEPRFARRSVPKKEMKANRDSHYTTSDYLLSLKFFGFRYKLHYLKNSFYQVLLMCQRLHGLNFYTNKLCTLLQFPRYQINTLNMFLNKFFKFGINFDKKVFKTKSTNSKTYLHPTRTR